MRIKYSFREEHPDTLVIMCSDGRFTRVTWEVLKTEHRTRYDTVTVPGGPALLDMCGGNMIEVEATRASTSFLIKGHQIKNVYLVAHRNCGFYAHRYAGRSQTDIEQRQVQEIKAATSWLRRIHPGLEIKAFMACPGAEWVDFVEIDLADARGYVYA